MAGDLAKYEKAFLGIGVLLLVACLFALVFASIAMGIQVVGVAEKIEPQQVFSTPPFDSPGVRKIAENRYEVVFIGQIWQFNPPEIRVPRGAEVMFIGTTPDLVHGFHVEGTRVNMMLLPGQVSRYAHTFKEPGERLVLCHEYCGAGHHTMVGKIIVE